jgi:RNA polymerase sigma-70 factor (ECF subfamily)
MTDRQLLERFARLGDEGAFAALVARHGAGVLAVCRRVLAHEQDAEDVAQATFLVLARKAALVRWRCSVERWLRSVAYRLALRARGSAVRRRLRERPVEAWEQLPEQSHPQANALAEVGCRELRRVVADELAALPEKYRAPVVLCYLEGKTNEEAAGQLGWPTGSMSRRLARARALLHQRLSRRGLALLGVLAVLAATTLWLGRPRSLVGPSEVSLAMVPFRPAAAGGQDGERDLLRLAEEGPGPDRERLARTARQAERAAVVLAQYAPARRNREWLGLATAMRTSAGELASALDAGEDRAAVAAARRLTASCQKCHDAFRR